MTETDPLAILRNRLSSNWTATPIAWTGIAFDPSDPGGSFEENGAWIFFDEDLPEQKYQADMGGDKQTYRTVSGVYIHVFTRANTGTGDARQYLGQLSDLFRGFTSGNLVCQVPYKSSSETDGVWYRTTLFVPYRIDNLL